MVVSTWAWKWTVSAQVDTTVSTTECFDIYEKVQIQLNSLEQHSMFQDSNKPRKWQHVSKLVFPM